MDPFLLPAIGMSMQGWGSLASTAASLYLGSEANQIERDNLRWQQEAFGQNVNMMREEQLYRRGLQTQMFAREDNAIQRRVADLKAAGLSPVLAAGQGAQSGPVVGSVVPQKQAAQMGLQGKLMQMQSMQSAAGIAKTMAETAASLSNVQGSTIQNELDLSTLKERIQQVKDAGGVTKQQLEEAKYRVSQAGIDFKWLRQLEVYVENQEDRLGYMRNPKVIEYAIATWALDHQAAIAKMSSKEAELTGKIPSTALSTALQLMLQFMRMLPK